MGGILESSCNDVMLSSSHPLLTSPSSLNVMVLMQLETAADINKLLNNINTEPQMVIFASNYLRRLETKPEKILSPGFDFKNLNLF